MSSNSNELKAFIGDLVAAGKGHMVTERVLQLSGKYPNVEADVLRGIAYRQLFKEAKDVSKAAVHAPAGQGAAVAAAPVAEDQRTASWTDPSPRNRRPQPEAVKLDVPLSSGRVQTAAGADASLLPLNDLAQARVTSDLVLGLSPEEARVPGWVDPTPAAQKAAQTVQGTVGKNWADRSRREGQRGALKLWGEDPALRTENRASRPDNETKGRGGR